MQADLNTTAPARVVYPISAHSASEFCRMAQACYRQDRNDLGHIFSGINAGNMTNRARWDWMFSVYRAWLVFNELPTEAEVANRPF